MVRVVEQEVPEGSRLELKQSLTLNDGAKGWRDKRQIHSSERDGLAKEIVALANMYGGNILIGVCESDTSPKRAVSLADPLPAVAELVDRLRISMASLIQPPIAGLNIVQVPHDAEENAGYIVVSVPASPGAPHGFGTPAQAYIRRDESASPMSMHDLQNSFWEARTKRERINEMVSSETKQLLETEISGSLVAFTFYAISENVLHLPKLAQDFLNNKVVRTGGQFTTYQTASAAPRPVGGPRWQPNSVGLETQDDEDEFSNSRWVLDESGLIVAQGTVAGRPWRDANQPMINVSWFLKTAGHLVALAEIIGEYCGSANAWIVGGGIRTIEPVSAVRDTVWATSQPRFKGTAIIRPRRFDTNLESDAVASLCSAMWGVFHQLDDDTTAFNHGYEEMKQFSLR